MKIRERIYRETGRIKYQLDQGMVDGKRVLKLFDSRKDAEKEMKDLIKARERHGDSVAALTAGEMAEVMHCRNRLAKVGVTLTEAVEFYFSHGDAVKTEVLLPNLVEAFRDSRLERNCSDRYHRQLGVSLGALALRYPLVKGHELTTEQLRLWLGGYKAAKTKNNYIGDVRAMYQWAALPAQGYVRKNPADGIEKFKAAVGDLQEIGTLTALQAGQILRAALDEVKVVGNVVMGMLGGIRPAELARMEWSAVDLEERTVIVGAAISKTRRRRVVDLTENAVLWIQAAQKRGLKLEGKITGPGWDARWRLFRASLGWDVGESSSGGVSEAQRRALKVSAKPHGVWPHDGLRHTYASMHYAMHQNETLLQAQMGHESANMLHQHYRALKTRKEAEAFWALSPRG